MQNKNYIYLVDNQIQFYNAKENYYNTCLLSKKILEDGKIIHCPKFLREFKIFLKKNQVIKKMQKNILYFISPPNFNETDKEILKKIFEDLPFQEIKIIKEMNAYQLKKNTLWINLNKEYAFLTYLKKHNKEIQVLKNNYLNYNFLNQFSIFLNNNSFIKKVYFFGSNPELIEITKKLEQKTQKIILYFEEPSKYIINQIARHNST